MSIVIGTSSAGALGTVTMGELKSMIQAEGYDTDTSTQQTQMIRAVLRSLYGMRKWPFLVTVTNAFSATVANQGVVDISSLGRAIKVDSVRVLQGTEYVGEDQGFTWMRDVDLQNLRFTARDAGFPARWTKRGDSIVVWPIPDNTYGLEIEYTALSTLPAADGDTIQWPEQHMDVLIYGVLMRLTRRQRDWAGFDRAKLSFMDALHDMERAGEDGPRQTDLMVEHWRGWDAVS
jgi:hypothetical protein